MEELKMHIDIYSCGRLQIAKIIQKKLRKFSIDGQGAITEKSETGLQSFVLAVRHWKMNLNQDSH